MDKPKKYAHYFKSGVNHFVVISDSVRPNGVTIVCTSKKDALEEAKHNNAVPWNF